MFYLDDGTLRGSLDDFISDQLHIEEGATRMGLKLNCNKCELICDDVGLINSMLSAVPGLLVVGRSHATLLGSPICDTLSMEECIRSRVETLIVIGKRLQLLSSHDALLLLRHSLSIKKCLYILCTAPCFLTDLLSTFDDHLRTLFSEILNVNLANESAWTQASLPVKAGGIGIRRATQLAPSAYLASAAGSSELIQLIPPSKLRGLTDPYFATGDEIWKRGSSADPPCTSQLTQQHALDSVLVEADYESLLENAATSLEKARLLAVSHHDSGAWLNAFPISALGLRLDDSEVQIAISLLRGLPVCSAHMCAGCGSAVYERGFHGLSCRFSKGRFSNHSALKDLIKCSLDSAKIPSHLEPTGVHRTNGKRPDGATLVPWKGGRVLGWDVTCADTLAPSHRQLASREAGMVAASAEQCKKNKYAHLEATHHFIPIAIETHGVVGEERRECIF